MLTFSKRISPFILQPKSQKRPDIGSDIGNNYPMTETLKNGTTQIHLGCYSLRFYVLCDEGMESFCHRKEFKEIFGQGKQHIKKEKPLFNFVCLFL
jgi:hypothetical protein